MSNDILETTIRNSLVAATGGDQAAYGRIVIGCQSMVTSIALSIVRDVPASQDIAQDAFLSAWQNLRKLGNPKSFLPWLRQITRNLARDHLRARAHRANPDGDIDALIAAVADPSADPEHALAEAQQARLAAELIDALPEDSRDVLLLYYREGQSSNRVAELLGLHDSAVRKRISRARETVRGDLLVRFGEFASGTAATAAFTATVLASVSLASAPAAASAVATGTSVLSKSAGKALFGSVSSMAFGIAAGLTGVWWGVGKYVRAPLDTRELRSLLAYGSTMSLLVAAFVATLVTASMEASGWQWPLQATAVYCASAFALQRFWLPRILARRRALEPRQVANSYVDAYSIRAQAHALQARLPLLHSGVQRAFSGDWTAWGYYRYLRAPLDASEKRELLRYALVLSLFAIGFVISIVAATVASDWRVIILVSMLYVAAAACMSQLWLPRILARRREIAARKSSGSSAP